MVFIIYRIKVDIHALGKFSKLIFSEMKHPMKKLYSTFSTYFHT